MCRRPGTRMIAGRAICFALQPGGFVFSRIPRVDRLAGFGVGRNAGGVSFERRHHTPAPVFGDISHPISRKIDRRARPLPARGARRAAGTELRTRARWLLPSIRQKSILEFIAEGPPSVVREAPIHRFDKTIRGNKAVGRYILGVIVARWLGGFHLIERHVFLDHVPNTISNNHHHVAKFDNIGVVADSPVARHDVGAAFLRFGGNRELQDMIQGQNFSLHAAAAFDVEEGISIGSENIAGADYVRASKQNQAVTVGVRVRLVINDDGFAVEVQVLDGSCVFVDGQALLGEMPAGPERAMSGG